MGQCCHTTKRPLKECGMVRHRHPLAVEAQILLASQLVKCADDSNFYNDLLRWSDRQHRGYATVEVNERKTRQGDCIQDPGQDVLEQLHWDESRCQQETRITYTMSSPAFLSSASGTTLEGMHFQSLDNQDQRGCEIRAGMSK